MDAMAAFLACRCTKALEGTAVLDLLVEDRVDGEESMEVRVDGKDSVAVTRLQLADRVVGDETCPPAEPGVVLLRRGGMVRVVKR